MTKITKPQQLIPLANKGNDFLHDQRESYNNATLLTDPWKIYFSLSHEAAIFLVSFSNQLSRVGQTGVQLYEDRTALLKKLKDERVITKPQQGESFADQLEAIGLYYDMTTPKNRDLEDIVSKVVGSLTSSKEYINTNLKNNEDINSRNWNTTVEEAIQAYTALLFLRNAYETSGILNSKGHTNGINLITYTPKGLKELFYSIFERNYRLSLVDKGIIPPEEDGRKGFPRLWNFLRARGVELEKEEELLRYVDSIIHPNRTGFIRNIPLIGDFFTAEAYKLVYGVNKFSLKKK